MALNRSEITKRYEERHPEKKAKLAHARYKSSCKSFLNNKASVEELLFFQELINTKLEELNK